MGTIIGHLEVVTTAEVISCADKLAAIRRLAQYSFARDANPHAAEVLALCDGDPEAMANWAADRPEET